MYEFLKIVGLLILTVAIVAVAAFIAYRISVSNLPDWFKFWLLRG